MQSKEKQVIGWKETVDLPDWGIEHIVAKADTGARRSAIDVKHLAEIGGNRVKFDVALHRKDRTFYQTVIAEISHQTHVRSSNGQQHERYFVKTRVRIGRKIRAIELSLVNRKNMTCRMLLGRKALEGIFVVDSSSKYLTRTRKKTSIKENLNE